MVNPVSRQLRSLPSVDQLLRMEDLSRAVENHGREVIRDTARDVLSAIRGEIQQGHLLLEEESANAGIAGGTRITESIISRIITEADRRNRPVLTAVFNLTGTVIHTNLGRAQLPDLAIQAIKRVAGQAVNLEFDLSTGTRGDRESGVESLICHLTGAEAATVVNNNAAAVVLVLTALAVDRDVVISRGELVEIGGSFRIPEVMGSAGCRLKEVGATNRTHLFDYAEAIDEKTALLMKVHTSNYAIQGFTSSVPETEIATLAQQHGLPFVVDLGSGTLIDLSRHGLPKEPTVSECLEQGADLVTFSGDKLLGGPQAGIVAGKKELVARLKKSPLKRALRVDKLTLAALDAVLRLYNNPSTLADNLPALRDLTRSRSEIDSVARQVFPVLQSYLSGIAEVRIVPCRSQIGSGALPTDLLESTGLEILLSGADRSDEHLRELATRFRSLPVPVIGRIHAGRLLFDLRCLRDIDGFCGQLQAD